MTTVAEIIDRVVVTVGEKIITQYDIDSFNPKQIKEIYAIDDEEQKKKVLKKYQHDVTQILVNQEVLEIAAAKEGVRVTEEEADAALEKVLENNNITRAQLEVLLIKDKVTLPEYKLSIKRDIFQSRLKSRIIAPMIVVTQEDIRKKVDSIAKEKGLSDQLELRMIVLDDKTKIKEVTKYLKKHSFTDTAIKYSVDSTSKQAGYLGWLKVNGLSKQLREAAKGKTFGDVFSVENADGKKMIFKVDGTKSIYDIEPELKETILEEIQKEQFESVFNAWLKKHQELIYIDYVE